MVYYTIVTKTPTGTTSKIMSKMHVVKVSKNSISSQRHFSIRFSRIKSISYEPRSTQFNIEHMKRSDNTARVKTTTTFQASSVADRSEWLMLLEKLLEQKRTEKKRMAERAKLERKILEGRVDLTELDDDILHAAQEGECHKLKVLRRTCDDVNVKTKDLRFRTALMLATTRGHFDAVRILLTPMYERFVGSDARLKAPKWVQEYNEFVAFRRCVHRVFPCTCQLRKFELLTAVGETSDTDWYQYKYKYCREVEIAFLKGEPSKTIENSKGRTFMLHLRKCTVRECLEDPETKAPIFEGTGKPVLMRRRLGCDINAADAMGWTALHLAIARGHEDIAAYLIEKGARVNVSNVTGYTPLMVAAQRGHLATVKRLIDREADVFATNRTHSTALHFAARAGHGKCCEVLCEAGSDVNALDADHCSPVHFACYRNDKESILTLVRYGARAVLSEAAYDDGQQYAYDGGGDADGDALAYPPGQDANFSGWCEEGETWETALAGYYDHAW